MILLLDENLPIKLKNYFSDKCTVYTVSEMKWSGIKKWQTSTINGRQPI